MKTAYFDCFSGISGDMCLGALVDAGVRLRDLETELRKLPVAGYSLSEKKVKRSGLAATKVDVRIKTAGPKKEIRTWRDIKRLVGASSLRPAIREKGLEIFKLLFDAEAAVHREDPERIHLHELGATDCIVDIFGTVIGLNLLGVGTVYASDVNVGGGTVKTEHGILPVPAPATAELLRGVPLYSSGVQVELTTPTGAAILRSISKGFGPIPLIVSGKTGYGAGGREIEGRPNVLRVLIGSTRQGSGGVVTVIETNIDDMNPQIYEYLYERLFAGGALDVFMTQVIMKKMRPAVKLSVICENDRRDDLISIVLRETTSLGVRWHESPRATMVRRMEKVKTEHGEVGMKVAGFGDEVVKTIPEYEDCKDIARKTGLPLLEVIEKAKRRMKKSKP